MSDVVPKTDSAPLARAADEIDTLEAQLAAEAQTQLVHNSLDNFGNL